MFQELVRQHALNSTLFGLFDVEIKQQPEILAPIRVVLGFVFFTAVEDRETIGTFA